MESIPQKTILQMRQSLEEMDIPPAIKTKASSLLDKIEAKGGMALKELKEIGKLLDGQKEQIKGDINSAKMAIKATGTFIRKTDSILQNYLTALKK